jgi:transcriptional regulator with XRE-family HTH domain
MKTGEKIANERRQINYTQEQLADYMEVTRQTVSKWESDLAYPETDKIIKLAGLFPLHDGLSSLRIRDGSRNEKRRSGFGCLLESSS